MLVLLALICSLSPCAEVETVDGITGFLRKVVRRGGQVVSVHFALDVEGLTLVDEDTHHRVLVYKAA